MGARPGACCSAAETPRTPAADRVPLRARKLGGTSRCHRIASLRSDSLRSRRVWYTSSDPDLSAVRRGNLKWGFNIPIWDQEKKDMAAEETE
uniref:Uncharacterized protein n=1 Tax=Sphaerodactylus townsendi TaxID=933632 RepID=A0ACB8ENF3_9SAUR